MKHEREDASTGSNNVIATASSTKLLEESKGTDALTISRSIMKENNNCASSTNGNHSSTSSYLENCSSGQLEKLESTATNTSQYEADNDNKPSSTDNKEKKSGNDSGSNIGNEDHTFSSSNKFRDNTISSSNINDNKEPTVSSTNKPRLEKGERDSREAKKLGVGEGRLKEKREKSKGTEEKVPVVRLSIMDILQNQ